MNENTKKIIKEEAKALKNFFIVLFIIIMVSATLQIFVGAQTTGRETLKDVKTATSTDTDIGAGKHQLTLYSAPVRTYNGSAWLDFIKTDFVDGYIVGYTEIDKNEFIWVTNITYDLARVCMNVTAQNDNVQLPLTKSEPKESGSVSNTAFYKLRAGETYCVWTDISSMKTIKFGEHSTTIGILKSDDRNFFQITGASYPPLAGSDYSLDVQEPTKVGFLANYIYVILHTFNLTGTGVAGTVDNAFYQIRANANASTVDRNITLIILNMTGACDIPVSVAQFNARLMNGSINTTSWWIYNYATDPYYNFDVTAEIQKVVDLGYTCVSIGLRPDNFAIMSGTNYTYWRDGSLNITYTAGGGDTTPPSPYFTIPSANNTYTANITSVLIFVNATENIFCTLENGTINLSMTPSGASCIYNMTGQSNNTQLNYRVFANDTTGNHNYTSWWRTTINLTYKDTTTPNPVFVSPTLANNSYTANVSWIFVNASAGEVISYCILQNATANLSMTANGLSCSYNFTNLANLTQRNFRVYFNDTAGNMNTTEWRRVTVNLTNYYPCTPARANITWTYVGNTTPVNTGNVSCNSSNIFTYNWTWTEWNWTREWDTHVCGGANITYYANISWSNHSYEACTFCTPSYKNDTWTYVGNITPAYFNVTDCNSTGNLVQYANWTEWNWTKLLDYNACGGYANTTIYYANISWGNWSVLGCTYYPPVPSVAGRWLLTLILPQQGEPQEIRIGLIRNW